MAAGGRLKAEMNGGEPGTAAEEGKEEHGNCRGRGSGPLFGRQRHKRRPMTRWCAGGAAVWQGMSPVVF